MDEAAFRAARPAVAGPACVFERALLARCAGCALAVPHALAEREAIGCRSPAARANCQTLLGMLRERAAFVLGAAPRAGPLPHATALRLACGGLRGLAHALAAADAHDVHALVRAAHERFGAFADLPWPDVVAAVAQWRGRPRHRSAP